MRYLLLIASDENAFAALSPEEQGQGLVGYVAFGEEMTKRGVLKSGERLRPTSEAVTVQVRDGETLTTDGPFIETKEQIGGFYIVEAKDQKEAVEIASKCPGAHHGTIEVRPLWDM